MRTGKGRAATSNARASPGTVPIRSIQSRIHAAVWSTIARRSTMYTTRRGNSGLLCNREGFPVAVEVFDGNTADPNPVGVHIEKLRRRFGLSRVVLVGNRGMLTEARIREEVAPAGLDWISALRAPAIRELVSSGAVQRSMFDETDWAELRSDAYPGERLIVCRNERLAAERARKREGLLQATEALLAPITVATQREKRRLRGKEKIARPLPRAPRRPEQITPQRTSLGKNPGCVSPDIMVEILRIGTVYGDVHVERKALTKAIAGVLLSAPMVAQAADDFGIVLDMVRAMYAAEQAYSASSSPARVKDVSELYNGHAVAVRVGLAHVAQAKAILNEAGYLGDAVITMAASGAGPEWMVEDLAQTKALLAEAGYGGQAFVTMNASGAGSAWMVEDLAQTKALLEKVGIDVQTDILIDASGAGSAWMAGGLAQTKALLEKVGIDVQTDILIDASGAGSAWMVEDLAQTKALLRDAGFAGETYMTMNAFGAGTEWTVTDIARAKAMLEEVGIDVQTDILMDVSGIGREWMAKGLNDVPDVYTTMTQAYGYVQEPSQDPDGKLRLILKRLQSSGLPVLPSDDYTLRDNDIIRLVRPQQSEARAFRVAMDPGDVEVDQTN